MEPPVGFEPTTYCLSRRIILPYLSRRWDLNPRPTVYKTVALPLSYFGKIDCRDSDFFSLIINSASEQKRCSTTELGRLYPPNFREMTNTPIGLPFLVNTRKLGGQMHPKITTTYTE